jgi:hypothetical protein
MKRIDTPDELVQQYDFTVDKFCEGCPLARRFEDFSPAYGVDVLSARRATHLKVVAMQVEHARLAGLTLDPSCQWVELKVGRVVSAAEVEREFEECSAPVRLESRRWWQEDEIVCSALNRLLHNKVPNKKNMKVDVI